MLSFFSTIRVVISLLPTLIHIIKIVEDIIPGKSKGEEKLELARIKLAEIYEKITKYTPTFEAIWKVAKPVITAIVKIFNLTGKFLKTPAK